MAQNEMEAKPALPERVRSMEGLGVNAAQRANVGRREFEAYFGRFARQPFRISADKSFGEYARASLLYAISTHGST